LGAETGSVWATGRTASATTGLASTGVGSGLTWATAQSEQPGLAASPDAWTCSAWAAPTNRMSSTQTSATRVLRVWRWAGRLGCREFIGGRGAGSAGVRCWKCVAQQMDYANFDATPGCDVVSSEQRLWIAGTRTERRQTDRKACMQVQNAKAGPPGGGLRLGRVTSGCLLRYN